MSLREAYKLAHTAECRLQMEASRPDRNLRFLVGHLLHYENLRLRIVEIEHDVSQGAHAQAVSIKGANDTSSHSKGSPLRQRSPPPPTPYEPYDDEDDDDISDEDDDDPWSGGSDEDEEEEGLSLQRFPSAAAQPRRRSQQISPPTDHDDLLDTTNSNSSSTAKAPSDTNKPHKPSPITTSTPTATTNSTTKQPQEDNVRIVNLDPDGKSCPDLLPPSEEEQQLVRKALQNPESPELAAMYEKVRRCRCHGQQDAPSFERVWELPAAPQTAGGEVDGGRGGGTGIRRALVQVAAAS